MKYFKKILKKIYNVEILSTESITTNANQCQNKKKMRNAYHRFNKKKKWKNSTVNTQTKDIF